MFIAIVTSDEKGSATTLTTQTKKVLVILFIFLFRHQHADCIVFFINCLLVEALRNRLKAD